MASTLENALRIILYLGSGGLLIHFIAPGRGPLLWLVILGLIVGMAYLDSWLFPSRRAGLIRDAVRGGPRRNKGWAQAGTPTGGSGKVVQFPGGKSGREGKKNKDTPQAVFASKNQQEADALVLLLRNQGMHPMMVSRTQSEKESGGAEYEVRVPQREMSQAKPLIEFFLMDSAEHPS